MGTSKDILIERCDKLEKYQRAYRFLVDYLTWNEEILTTKQRKEINKELKNYFNETKEDK